MAESRGVWGIEIGQAALKAIRLRYADAAKQAIAVAFDYVPHAKILSQPDAIPEELVPQALETFLSRNDIAGDRICISVPGQSALARFIQLPPVESSRVAEIVKYEARQQIPFDLEDVIWDFQRLGGGTEESGFLLEAEVGLFAMKRDQVQSTLQPFVDHKVEVDVIQIAPLALYNMLAYDQMGIRREAEDPPEAGTEHTVLIDMGADNSTLVVSNGEKIWIRNVPIGGNHFTRALTKEMKLTFAKAEHLKCNATKSPDPRAVFQAMRPVFNDYVSEIQRSIGYFSSVNREASIKRVVGMGNGFKLAGLQKFLQQNLSYEVERIDTFKGLVGDNVLGDAVFRENVLSFAAPYGLALQGLDVTPIHTTLLPPEIAMARKIRRKKPWAVATAATMLLGLATSVAVSAGALAAVGDSNWGEAKKKAENLAAEVAADGQDYQNEQARSDRLDAEISQIVAPHENQYKWLELLKAVYDCVPHPDPDERELNDLELLPQKHTMRISAIRAAKVADTSPWQLVPGNMLGVHEADETNPPSGPGYIVRVEGQHYHHDEKDASDRGVVYVEEHLLDNLHQWDVPNPDDPRSRTPVRDLGISHARFVDGEAEREIRVAKGDIGAIAGAAAGAVDQERLEDEFHVELLETSFIIEFVWQPLERTERRKFTTVREVLQSTPGADLEAARQAVRKKLGLPLTQDEFARFKTRYEKGPQPPGQDNASPNEN